MTVENQILVIRLKKDSSKTNVNYNSKNGLHNLIRIIIRTVDLWITHIAPLQHPFLLPFLTWRARTLPQHLLSLSLSFPSEPVVFTKLPVIFQSSFRRTIVRACPPSLNVSRETFTLIRRGRPGGLPMLHVKHRQ